MPSRKISFVPGEYYHICNRGIDGRVIYEDERDYVRFLFLILYLQSSQTHQNIGTFVTRFLRSEKFMDGIREHLIASLRTVSLISFACMPNHFHLLIREEKNGGISFYLQRIENAYTRYYNIRHDRRGHIFQGPFRAQHIDDNNQLLYVSAYIHRNPRELHKWKGKESVYPWSSYPDYITRNRWPYLLDRGFILSQFDKKNSYEEWLRSSPAKLDENEKYVDLFDLGGQ